MKWTEDGHVCVRHPRRAWDCDCYPRFLVHADWADLKGTSPRGSTSAQEQYRKAKHELDFDAAYDIVDRLIDRETLDNLARVVKGCASRPKVIVPTPSFDDEDPDPLGGLRGYGPRNALPIAYKAFVCEVLGCEADAAVLQSARVGRTKLNTFLRFLCQPSFTGSVSAGEAYIILDDVITTGGTFAALRSYIVGHGGIVVAASALAKKNGTPTLVGVETATVEMLKSFYGDGLGAYWRGAVGHEISHLTESEAQFLLDWGRARVAGGQQRGDSLLHLLRARLDQAASTGG